jgi:alanine racemase
LDFRKSFSGIYTHFASAKDINYPTYTELQFDNFNKILNLFKTAGFKNLEKHVAATGATLINKKYHLDAVRVGIGLYGLWPSRELEVQLSSAINLKPILSWRTLVSEVKNIKQGSFIGYDLVEKTDRPIKIAVLPLGYWHGFSRNLSGIGEILIKGKKCRVLGRVSMDLIVVDVTGADVCVGDYATIIGMDFKNNISAFEISSKSQTSYYEFVTRLNPLIKRVVV